MAQNAKYAKDQQPGFTNRIERVAIVGAGGSVGKYIAQELLKTGKHTVTALMRTTSMTKLPEGLKVAQVDYDDEATLVSALREQQFLVITLSVLAPPETHSKLVQAAAKAAVPYVMPNSYGADIANDSLQTEGFPVSNNRKACAGIEATGVSSWIALVCGFWYEFSLLAGSEWFGFDFEKKKLTLYDAGNTRINISTWEQCGRAVAALLSLKELPDDETDSSPAVSTWKNRPLYISSFCISQTEMFESWKRVTGDYDEDWTVDHEPTGERYASGLKRLRDGDRRGYAQAMYARCFYSNGDGDYEHKYGLANTPLGLPSEDLDQHTKVAKVMHDQGYSYFSREG